MMKILKEKKNKKFKLCINLLKMFSNYLVNGKI